jgi:hypothetical protein
MVLYDTKIKDFSFKFYVDNKKAQVLDIEHRMRENEMLILIKLKTKKTY